MMYRTAAAVIGRTPSPPTTGMLERLGHRDQSPGYPIADSGKRISSTDLLFMATRLNCAPRTYTLHGVLPAPLPSILGDTSLMANLLVGRI